ncbi:MAG TPA: copper resistance CopC family protein [Microlunatus sp.]|nr:copper resistance CopC family protein [Microlunatus sp.]
MSRASRIGARFVGVLLAALVGSLVATGPAEAHNVLRSTSPADGSTVDVAPAEIVLTFEEPAITMGTVIVVTGPDGPATSGAARLIDDTVHQQLAGGAPAGRYTVQWRVTSADGHPITGTFAFTATTAGGGSGPAPGPPGSVGAPTPQTTAPATPGDAAPGVPGWLWALVVALLVVAGASTAVLARRHATRNRPR